MKKLVLMMAMGGLMACSAMSPKPLNFPISQASATGLGDERSELMYQLLVGELAGRRGDLPLALNSYLEAAEQSDDPRVAERATQLAIYAQQWEVALRAGERWLQLDPQSADANRLMATVHLRNGNTEASAQAFLQVLADTPADQREKAIKQIVALLARESQRGSASHVLAKLSDAYPDDLTLWLARGRHALKQGENEQALDHLAKARAVDPDSGDAVLLYSQSLLNLDRAEDGRAVLEGFLASHPEDINVQTGLARLMVQMPSVSSEALAKQLSVVGRLANDKPVILFGMGLLAYERGLYDESRAYLQRTIDLEHRVSDSHYFLASVEDAARRYAEAIQHYDQVTDGDNVLSARLRSVELMGEVGELEQGSKRLERLRLNFAGQIAPEQAVLAESSMYRHAGQMQKAYDILSGGLEEEPANVRLLYARALLAERIGNESVFEQDLNKVLAIEPENGQAMNALGYFFADRNIRLAEAEKLLTSAYKLLPDDAAVVDSMGWLLFRRGDYQGALGYLRKAYQMLPDPEIAAHLGEVLWVSGKREQAESIWNDALQINKEKDGDMIRKVMERLKGQ